MKRLIKADDEYKRLLKVMERDPNFCTEEIEMYQGSAIISKSIDIIRSRASKLKENRESFEDLRFSVASRVHKNLEIQQSFSPEHKKKPKSGKKKGKGGKSWADLNKLSDRSGDRGKNPPPKALTQKKNKPTLNKSIAAIKPKPIPEKPQLCFGKTIQQETINENYNPFSITTMEMRRIKQSVHLTDDALKKLFERERMIEEYQNDLDYI